MLWASSCIDRNFRVHLFAAKACASGVIWGFCLLDKKYYSSAITEQSNDDHALRGGRLCICDQFFNLDCRLYFFVIKPINSDLNGFKRTHINLGSHWKPHFSQNLLISRQQQLSNPIHLRGYRLIGSASNINKFFDPRLDATRLQWQRLRLQAYQQFCSIFL